MSGFESKVHWNRADERLPVDGQEVLTVDGRGRVRVHTWRGDFNGTRLAWWIRPGGVVAAGEEGPGRIALWAALPETPEGFGPIEP